MNSITPHSHGAMRINLLTYHWVHVHHLISIPQLCASSCDILKNLLMIFSFIYHPDPVPCTLSECVTIGMRYYRNALLSECVTIGMRYYWNAAISLWPPLCFIRVRRCDILIWSQVVEVLYSVIVDHIIVWFEISISLSNYNISQFGSISL